MKYYNGGMRLDVPEGVYCPREDSELMAESIAKIDMAGMEVLEMGCGSGLLSIIAAKRGGHVTAADINPSAVDATKQNAGMNNVIVNVRHSDLFQNVTGKYDIIIFNPPYLPAEDDDPTYAGGPDGRQVIEKFLRDAPRFLQPRGKILLLISSLTGEQETIELARKAGLDAVVMARKKIPWEELLVLEMAR